MTANVPCDGCTACCKRELILLRPQDGDQIADYKVDLVHNPFTGEPGFALKHQANGDCIYLGPHGCTIHDRAPVVCREFDCRRWFQQCKAEMRRYPVNAEMVAAARKRLPSLRIEERAARRK